MIENVEMIEEYEMNPQTMILLPFQCGTKLYTRIIEFYDEYVSPHPPIDIVRKSCEYFGSSYEGRREGTKRLTGIVYKAPIIIDSHTSIFSFPTTSPSHSNCIWVCEKYVHLHERVNAKMTNVIFKNGQSFHIPISASSFGTQRARTLTLTGRFMYAIDEMKKKEKHLLERQTNELEKKTNYWVDGRKRKNRV
ncbi:competence protein ComK [Bacillus spongiae]|uniref:Competence protein ComK n=1 Tax=Bacillus spongiae TaxID=2683610 RepID=A0ABU8HBD7_9BACI